MLMYCHWGCSAVSRKDHDHLTDLYQQCCFFENIAITWFVVTYIDCSGTLLNLVTLNRLPQGQTIVDHRDTPLKKALLADTSFCLLLVHIQLVTFEIIICAANWVTYKRIHVSFKKCQVMTNPSRLDSDAPKPLDFLAFHENEADLEEQVNPKCTINLILFNSN